MKNKEDQARIHKKRLVLLVILAIPLILIGLLVALWLALGLVECTSGYFDCSNSSSGSGSSSANSSEFEPSQDAVAVLGEYKENPSSVLTIEKQKALYIAVNNFIMEKPVYADTYFYGDNAGFTELNSFVEYLENEGLSLKDYSEYTFEQEYGNLSDSEDGFGKEPYDNSLCLDGGIMPDCDGGAHKITCIGGGEPPYCGRPPIPGDNEGRRTH